MDVKEEKQWLDDCEDEVYAYLIRENIIHGRIEARPSWFVAPYVSIWGIESAKEPETIGWWVICGDLPTDYISSTDIKSPRDVVKEFSNRWQEISLYMLEGKQHPTIKIGSSYDLNELGSLLNHRANILSKWGKDESNWN